jgi:hypothetical protein
MNCQEKNVVKKLKDIFSEEEKKLLITIKMVNKVDFLALFIAHTFFSPGKLIKKSELVLA